MKADVGLLESYLKMNRLGKTFIVLVITVFALLIAINPISLAQTDATGDLAIVGNDGNIYLYDTTTDALSALTTDAAPIVRGYQWPTWSTDGQLAFFRYDLQQGNFGELSIFVRPLGGTAQEVFTQANEAFTYAFWSPSDCPTASATPCRDLAVLYTRQDGNLALRNVRVADDINVTELSVGGPHYWDWSPDGTTMFWARFGEDLELYDVEMGTISGPLPQHMGRQQAVDWSPTDDRLLTTLAGPNNTSTLTIIDGDNQQILVDGLRAGIAFAWSADATQIAYLDYEDGRLEIIRSSDGSTVLTPSNEVLAFLWSPDGTKIAYLTLAQSADGQSAKQSSQNAPELQWHILDVAAKQTAHHRRFIPTQTMIYYLNFFDQFAHSHQFWSSDSRFFAFGEIEKNGSSVISLIDTSASTDTIVTIAEGTVGVFNWGP
jgi:hypothetical protein